MEEISRAYAGALFAVAKDRDKLDPIREQLGQFADALHQSRDLQVFFFSPYFSSGEKREGIARAVSGAEPEVTRFLELLASKHRMPAVFLIRERFDALWAQERKHLEVTLTSAVELDPKIAKRVGEEIERQTGHEVDLETVVDERVLGGLVLRVGNMVLDASIQNRLEKLRREVAPAA